MRARADDLVVTRWGARFRGRRFPCAVGRGGIRADKREGDGATPAGTLRLIGSGFRPDRLTRPLPTRPVGFRMTPIRPGDIWSDDPADPRYNHQSNARSYEYRHERLSRADRMYDVFVITDL